MTSPHELAKKLEESDLTDPNTAVFGYIYATTRSELQETLDSLDLRVRGYGDPEKTVVASRNLHINDQPAILQITQSYRGRDQFQVAVRWDGEQPTFTEDFLDTVNKAVENSKARNPVTARNAALENLRRSNANAGMLKLLNKLEARGPIEDPLDKYFA